MVKDITSKVLFFYTPERVHAKRGVSFFTGRLSIKSGTKYTDMGDVDILHPTKFITELKNRLLQETGENHKVWFEIKGQSIGRVKGNRAN